MNLLTIDLEDWFHILAYNETEKPEQWENFESRVERNTDWILEQLLENNQRATFFCLGWIAAKYPDLIRKIAGNGHEIACHSMHHQLVFNQSRNEFAADLTESLDILSDLAGKRIQTYRAPGFSLTEKTKWVFEVLASHGIKNDCSVFPLARNHGGFPEFPSLRPCLIKTNGIQIREFPVSVAKFSGKQFVFSGGGYFRLFPYIIIKALMRRSGYVMTYFHPRDFDPAQPVLSNLSLKRKFMSYTGLRGAGRKFEMLLKDFRFHNVQDAADIIFAERVPIVALN